MIKGFAVLLPLLLLLPSLVSAATINAASCNQTDVQSAIDSSQDGDIIMIPAGNCVWTDDATLGKDITLQGAGTGQTIISRPGDNIFYTSGESANGFRVTGIEFRSCTQCFYLDGTGIPKEAAKDFRIDNCKFKDALVAFETDGGSRGVLDHNIFEDSYGARIYGSNDASATFPFSLGTENAVFFEDNIITVSAGASLDHFIASNSGSHYVIRHNSFTYDSSLWDVIDAHGYCEVAGRGSFTWEVYNNTFTLPDSLNRVMRFRGGQGVVHDNIFLSSAPSYPIVVTDYMTCSGSSCVDTCSGYPCKDQITASYFWNNKFENMVLNVTNDCPDVIQENRDYWNSEMPGYTSFTYPHPLTQEDIIPEDRRIYWEPGIPGGIPIRNNICATIDASTYGDGITDATSAIQTAINNCPQDGVVYIPEGDYRLTSELAMFEKGVVLRGDGPDKTRLLQYSPRSVIRIYAWGSRPVASVESGYTRGSYSVTVNDSSGFSIGDLVIIDQQNDPSLVSINDNNPCNYCSREGGNRAMGQSVLITEISGNNITFNRPLYLSFDPAFSPQMVRVSDNPPRNAGIEDLYLESVNGGGGSNIDLQFCINCWIKNIESSKAYENHVRMRTSYGCEIRDSYFHHGHTYTGGRAYGIWVFAHSSDNLIENNVFYYLRHSMVIESGGTGNVFGYSYSERMFDAYYPNTDWLMSDLSLHGAHPYMNLYEGNKGQQLTPDFTHGSSSHNTFFRNYVTRQSEGEAEPVIYRLIAVDIFTYNYFINIIGNILCTEGCSGLVEQYPVTALTDDRIWRLGFNNGQHTGDPSDPNVAATVLRHGNFNYVSNSVEWDPAISSHDLPDSYYLDAKPAFFGSLNWPAYGPDTDYANNKIPAEIRFGNIRAAFTCETAGYECCNSCDGSGDVAHPEYDASCISGVCCLTDMCVLGETCQTMGYSCCSSCEPGTEQTQYDSDCPGVCCGECESTGLYFLPENYIEAENGEITSPMAIGSDALASGGLYVYTPTSNQGLVNFTFSIQNAGKYRMEARTNTHMDGGENSFFVGVDDEPANGDSNYVYDPPLLDGFVWDDVHLRGFSDPMIWDLTQGLHNFTFYGREMNTWLDQIILMRAYHRSDSNEDGCIETGEMIAFMDRWKISSIDVPMPELMESIGLWKTGTGCS